MHHILHYTLLLLQHSSECGYLSRFAKLSGFIAVTTTAKVKTFAMVANKIFPENWDSKAPSVGTLLAYLGTMAKIIYFHVFQDRKRKLSACV